MTPEQVIRQEFRSRIEELCFQSTGGGTDKYGFAVTDVSFWNDAMGIVDQALDAIDTLKE